MDNNVENNINSEFNGLTAAEVNARIEAGKINIADDSSDRTTGKIIRDNLLTYFMYRRSIQGFNISSYHNR